MKRKVIQIANSTQLISLPRKWALKHNIKKGEEIDVEIDGNRLIIGGKKNAAPQSASLKFDKNSKYVRRPLSTLYKLGYDEVEITYDNPEFIKDIKDHIVELLGFEIIQQTGTRCLVKNIASTMDTEFDNILRRIFLMLVTFAKESYQAIKDDKPLHLQPLTELEKTNNKLTFFCERVLNKFGYPDHKKQLLLHTMISLLEQVADSFRSICLHFKNNKKAKLSKNTLELYKNIVDFTEEVYKTFYNFNINKLSELKEQRVKQETLCYKNIQNAASGHDAIITHHLLVISYLLHHSTECFI